MLKVPVPPLLGLLVFDKFQARSISLEHGLSGSTPSDQPVLQSRVGLSARPRILTDYPIRSVGFRTRWPLTESCGCLLACLLSTLQRTDDAQRLRSSCQRHKARHNVSCRGRVSLTVFVCPPLHNQTCVLFVRASSWKKIHSIPSSKEID